VPELLTLACENAMAPKHEVDLVWLLLPAVFLLVMFGATVYLVLRTQSGEAKDGN
jgi:hypothetical protein